MKDIGLVSVVMPMYNCEQFVAQSIESVQAQTYQNWELLLVDDCSTDRSVEIARQYADADNRIRLLQNSQNSGAAVSRNYAIREAKGKWIATLDSDDLWMTKKLEKQLVFMEKHDYHFSYTQYTEMTEAGIPSGYLWTGPKKVGRLKMTAYNFVGCLTVMYDASYVGLVQIPDLKKRNDYAMWLKVVKKSPCYLLAEPLSQYRIRQSGSITDRKGGILPIIRHHYNVFRISEELNPVFAAFCTCLNLGFGALKKVAYRKKV